MGSAERSHFAVVGKLDTTAAIDIVISGGQVEHSDECATSMLVDGLVTEPGDTGSRLAGDVTCRLLGNQEHVFICYDLTSDAAYRWIEKLEVVGFSVLLARREDTGRELGLCMGEARRLEGTNWLEPVWPMDDTFLAAGAAGGAMFPRILTPPMVASIFRAAIQDPAELWRLIPEMRLFACLAGDDGDNLLLRRRQPVSIEHANTDTTDVLINAARKLAFLLYDAHYVTGCSTADFLKDDDSTNHLKWRGIPEHWHRLL